MECPAAFSPASLIAKAGKSDIRRSWIIDEKRDGLVPGAPHTSRSMRSWPFGMNWGRGRDPRGRRRRAAAMLTGLNCPADFQSVAPFTPTPDAGRLCSLP